jgi:predicted DNA-binding protein
MATYPLPPGKRQINLEMPEEMVRHLDRRARETTTTAARCSRASYVRKLIEEDMAAHSTAA